MTARRWLAGLVIGAFALRLALAGNLPLTGDEAYHWEWSRHLAGAYYDHPGMTGWIIHLASVLLPGGAERAVRLPAILGSAVAALLAFGLARDVVRATRTAADGDRAGLWAALLVTCMPLPAAFGVYMSTDAPLLPIGLAFAWACHAAAEHGRLRAWVALGVTGGLALSTKLLVLPLLGTAGLWLGLSVRGRASLRTPGPWVALLVALVAATPLWWWNATHDWMTFRFNFEIRQRDQPTEWWHPLVFIGGQLAVLTPGLAVLGLTAAGRGVRARSPGVHLLAWMALAVLGGFLLLSLRRKIGVHWTMPAWSILLVLIAVEHVATSARFGWRRLAWRSSLALGLGAFALAHVLALAPEYFARLDLIAGQPARVMRPLFGWRELGVAVDERVAELRATQADGRGVFLASDQYGVAAAVAFYAPSRPRVHLWSQSRHGRNYEFWDDWAAMAGQDLLLVCKRMPHPDVLAALRARCVAVAAPDAVAITRDGVEVNRFYLVVARGFDGQRPFAPL